jgi:hypothetical protein
MVSHTIRPCKLLVSFTMVVLCPQWPDGKAQVQVFVVHELDPTF